jgi:hypothetical protein
MSTRPIEIKTIDAQVRILEEELKALKTLVEHAPKDKKGTKTFASLKGIWKGKVHFTMNEIKESEIQIKEYIKETYKLNGLDSTHIF